MDSAALMYFISRWPMAMAVGSKDASSPNSIQVIPRDQTSTLPSYCPSSIARITSGAILVRGDTEGRGTEEKNE